MDVYEDSGGIYGRRKIRAALARKGIPVAKCTVERLCGDLGIRGVVRGKFPRTTKPAPETDRPADLVDRAFCATAPNQLWVADITYVRTDVGWVYVAFVLDVFSRMIVGWQTSTRMFADLAIDALAMGLWQRRRAGHDITGLIHHSDRGVQYRAIRYTQALDEAGAVASVGSRGDSYDCEDRVCVTTWCLTPATTGPAGVFALTCRPRVVAFTQAAGRVGSDLIGA